MIKKPGVIPDVTLFPLMIERSWNIGLKINSAPWDITASTFVCRIYDDETELDLLTVVKVDAPRGLVQISIGAVTIAKLGRYSTWRLYESPKYNTVLAQGRIVKQR